MLANGSSLEVVCWVAMFSTGEKTGFGSGLTIFNWYPVWDIHKINEESTIFKPKKKAELPKLHARWP
jgi:hypothetical protein